VLMYWWYCPHNHRQLILEKEERVFCVSCDTVYWYKDGTQGERVVANDEMGHLHG
jgi:hypothetical protein